MSPVVALVLVALAVGLLTLRDAAFSKPGRRRQAQQVRLSVDQAAIIKSANGYARVINESLKLARESKNPATKVSRLNVANDNLRELKRLADRFPMIRLISLREVEAEVRALSHEFADSGIYEAANRIAQPDGARPARGAHGRTS